MTELYTTGIPDWRKLVRAPLCGRVLAFEQLINSTWLTVVQTVIKGVNTTQTQAFDIELEDVMYLK